MKRYGKVEILGGVPYVFEDQGEVPANRRFSRGEPVRPTQLIEFVDEEDHCAPDYFIDRGASDESVNE